ncbi:hypothetical protein PTRA_a1909 [Pseudoalteromonas translucida KMM 520]|uniref:Transcriptional regulator VspR n=1 Tax=Pseudoalteromonas translucida KMM 520 TaxID=1315283 RepID=A0A0U2WIF0_9GAMM|nr:hypothetical protein [Pseudoalteromonas translucida]ALS33050.1 hypothetical protein PTRA_a1909 [Pseudoalteromonas translucida KMM 520]
MPQVIKLNQHIYSLLLEKECNGFTIVELRDELLTVTDTYQDIDEARKFIYRQTTALERKEILISKGSGRNKKYFKSELFNKVTFEPKQVAIEQEISISCNTDNQASPLVETLLNEKNQFEAELAILLGEVDEYKALQKRFPDHLNLFYSALDDAKNNSAKLLGKVNALTTVLSSLNNGAQQC